MTQDKTDTQAQTIKDINWWRAFGKQFGWRLCRFNHRHVATFITAKYSHVEITREVRDNIHDRIRSIRNS